MKAKKLTKEERQVLSQGGTVQKYVDSESYEEFMKYVARLNEKGFGTTIRHQILVENLGTNTYTITVSV